jgi:membrane protease YdiL (CAAX protease family)
MLSERPWKLETVPYLLAGLFISVCMGSVVVSLTGLSALPLDEQQQRFFLLVANTVFVHGALLVMIAIFLRVNRVGWMEAFGFRHGRLGWVLLLGTGAAALIIPVTWLLTQLSACLIQTVGGKAEAQTAVQFLQASPPLGEKLFMGFTTILLAPVVEEMLFRGIFYPSIKQAGFPRVALFGVAFLFAAYHSNLMTFIPLYLLAILLTVVYETTDNLLTAILLHAWFNAVNYVVLITGWDMERWFKSLF